ncbi:MAG: type II secretion system protein [Candidatus Levybacteria bacterium]|nr:type II secretion system protein [Candidatus Levybacteria bacterium]
MNKLPKNQRYFYPFNTRGTLGFTLIELLVVIGILAVLFAIVLVAINPARQFSQANDTKRSSDVNALLNAIHQYAADNRGNLAPLGITATATEIGDTVGMIDICDELVPTYIAGLPRDPLLLNGDAVTDCSQAYETDYTVMNSATDNRITVEAPGAEIAGSISVTR